MACSDGGGGDRRNCVENWRMAEGENLIIIFGSVLFIISGFKYIFICFEDDVKLEWVRGITMVNNW